MLLVLLFGAAWIVIGVIEQSIPAILFGGALIGLVGLFARNS